MVTYQGQHVSGYGYLFLILLVTFCAFTAAGLPILTALIGVVIALTGVTAVVDVASSRWPSCPMA
jgi:RND superfamily putative drug exporter